MSLPQIQPSFSRSLEAFKNQLSPVDIEAFERTTFDDVMLTLRNIEKEQGLRQDLRCMRRIEPFMAVFQQYARIVELCIDSKLEFLAFVWVGTAYFLELTLLVHLEAFG